MSMIRHPPVYYSSREPVAGLLHIRDGRVIRVNDYWMRRPHDWPGLVQYMDGGTVVYERTYQEGEEVDSYIERGDPCGINYYTGHAAVKEG